MLNSYTFPIKSCGLWGFSGEGRSEREKLTEWHVRIIWNWLNLSTYISYLAQLRWKLMNSPERACRGCRTWGQRRKAKFRSCCNEKGSTWFYLIMSLHSLSHSVSLRFLVHPAFFHVRWVSIEMTMKVEKYKVELPPAPPQTPPPPRYCFIARLFFTLDVAHSINANYEKSFERKELMMEQLVLRRE